MMKKYRILIGAFSAFKLNPTVGFPYIGYREKNASITLGQGRVLRLGDDAQFQKLVKKARPYSVMYVKAEMEGKDFIVKRLIKMNALPLDDERTFLETIADPQLGVFILDRRVNMFFGNVTYLQKPISIGVESKADLETFRGLYGELDALIKSAARYAAEQLLDTGNDWCYDAWAAQAKKSEQYTPITENDFVERISIASIYISDGGYTLWFNDGDIFWGHAIHVDGDQKQGFWDASISG